MARFAGKTGGVTDGKSGIAFSGWEIDAAGDAIDVTGFDSAGAKEFVAGLTEWSGTAEGFVTGSVAAYAPGSTIAGVVFASAGAGSVTLTGTIIVTSLRVGTAVAGAVTVSIGFQGTGPLAYGTV